MKDSPLRSSAAFRHAFSEGLASLLRDYNELGVYILVMANACFDPLLWSRLETVLQRRFAELADDLRERRRAGLMLDDAVDDLRVFEQMMAVGLEQLSATEFRRCGPWELQFNPLRAFRPPRAAGTAISGIHAPFDPDRFNFNRPFLRKEIFWQGQLAGRKTALFYNKFPFVSLHGLLVPEPAQGRQQLLSQADNDYLWRVTETLAATLPGVGFGYNSYGANASVNHLHFQIFQRQQPLPIADHCWRHNGGQLDYPLDCHVCADAAASWRLIRQLHEREISYNLVCLPGRIYCIPRRRQDRCQHGSWAAGFAWYETAGGFTAFDRSTFAELDQQRLAAALAQLRIDLP